MLTTDPGEGRGAVEIGTVEEREAGGHGLVIGLEEMVDIGECDFGEIVGIEEHCFGERGESVAAIKSTKRMLPLRVTSEIAVECWTR